MEENLTIAHDKQSIFFKFLNFISRFLPKNKDENLDSQFDHYLNGISKKSPEYDSIRKTSDLCHDAVNVAKQRISYIRKIQETDEKMLELDAYSKISAEEIKYLKNMLEKYQALNRDRNNLMYKMTGFDRSLKDMERKVDDAKYVMERLRETEKNHRILKNDLTLLQGEKAELEYDYEKMTTAQNFIYKGFIGLVIFFGSLMIVLSYLFAFKKWDTFLPASILCFSLIMLFTFIYIFRKKLQTELKINVRKQEKIRTILNKKNVVYAYYVSFLNYVYKKYNVRSAEKLNINIKAYSEYKNVTTRFDHIRKSMYETEREIESFLRKKKISGTMITIEGFAKTMNIEDKKRVYNGYAAEKKRLEERLAELDKLHEKIWNNLVILHDSDNTKDEIIGKIIQSYIDEVGNIANIDLGTFAETETDNMNVNDIDKLFIKIAEINKSIEKDEKEIDPSQPQEVTGIREKKYA